MGCVLIWCWGNVVVCGRRTGGGQRVSTRESAVSSRAAP
jgi:hypothetical protein